MKTISLTEKELEEITFSLMCDKLTRNKTDEKAFITARKKFINTIKSIK